MVKFSSLKKKRKEEGQWVDYEAGIKLKLAPMGNKNYDRILTKLASKKKRLFRKADASNPEILKITQHAVSEAVLLDWSGIEGDDGQALAYDPEKAREIFADNYDFYKDVIEMSGELKSAIKEDEEDAEGN